MMTPLDVLTSSNITIISNSTNVNTDIYQMYEIGNLVLRLLLNVDPWQDITNYRELNWIARRWALFSCITLLREQDFVCGGLRRGSETQCKIIDTDSNFDVSTKMHLSNPREAVFCRLAFRNKSLTCVLDTILRHTIKFL